MSGPPRVKSMNLTEPEARSVLGPAGNKARSVEPPRKQPIAKSRAEKTDKSLEKSSSPTGEKKMQSELGFLAKNGTRAATILRQNLSLNASSCSSDASSDSCSSQSRPSTGGVRSNSSSSGRKSLRKKIKEREAKEENFERCESEGIGVKKRCAWVTANCDPLYTAFHDEEWGLPVHDDKKIFELLSFSTALAELTWPVILSKRPMFREVFLDFDPFAVSKLNDKKLTSPGSLASTLLSELKLRAIIDNARQICKIIDEFGSFDKYIWSFVNHKPTVGNFRYPRQVPIKTSKAESISKDLVRRGFRGVGPTVVYSFMQVCGMTNDHLITCFRYQDCVRAVDMRDTIETVKSVSEENSSGDLSESELVRQIDDLSLSR